MEQTMPAKTKLAQTVKELRKRHGLTQVQAAEYAGVGLRFVWDLETGKKTLRMDKVNSLLYLFGLELGPVPVDRKSDNEIEK